MKTVMKTIKKSISLPEDLFKYIERMALMQARERGSSVNISQYVRELVAKDRDRRDLKQAA